MTLPMKGRIALVTGASRGIGLSISTKLAEAGAHVIALGRSLGEPRKLDQDDKFKSGKITPYSIDLRQYDQVYELARSLDVTFGKIDALVSCAAIVHPLAPLGEIDQNLWDETLSVNLTVNWHLIKAFDPLLKKSDAGRAVFFTSGVATLAWPNWAPYSVSKAGLDQLVRVYAAECSSGMIKANLFSPGPTRTGMRATVAPEEDPLTLPTPDEVAQKVIAMCLPAFSETGKIYDFRASRLMEFQRPC
ncbi:SDR family NAD(P)-dependent oxidoreductase [Rhizobium sp. NZLR11]|uniref:SDR family NAD(P)-dependent oxidoreductase n=1 Tax=Rhizobium sp. NZLR11 TaxID=2731098 RepID=UPI001C83A5ED|nr:SDR family oxidoreductase [Rhizobium sp. NZLR11]MBX5210463.1 SDR family oxidoreductase [Rhizobium sp. NZLR11]